MSDADFILMNTEGWKREGMQIQDRSGNSIAMCRTVNDAAMLISCVNLAQDYCRQDNAHDELVAALEMAMQCSAPAAVGLPSAWLDKAKAALAKAKGDEG